MSEDNGKVTITRPPATDGRMLPRPYIATPCYGGQMFTTFGKSLVDLCCTMLAAGLKFKFSLPGNESLITRARNKLVAEFLKTNCTHLVWIDADVGFDPSDVAIMCNSGLDVVCGAYPMKNVGWENVRDAARHGAPAVELAARGGMYAVNPKIADMASGEADVKVIGGRPFLPVRDGATGFMSIKRSVIEQMIIEYGEDIRYVADYEEAIGAEHHALFDCVIDTNDGARERALRALKRDARLLLEEKDEQQVQERENQVLGAALEWAKVEKETRDDVRYLSEDYAFSRRWQAMGGEIYLHLGQLTHTGMFTFTGDISRIIQFEGALHEGVDVEMVAP